MTQKLFNHYLDCLQIIKACKSILQVLSQKHHFIFKGDDNKNHMQNAV